MLSAAELEDLIKRCKYAHAHGFQIANAEEYAKELGYAGEDPPTKVRKHSPAHLLHLATASQPKLQASAKFTKVGKSKKATVPASGPPAPKQEDIPTVPVDIRAVAAAVAEMKGDAAKDES